MPPRRPEGPSRPGDDRSGEIDDISRAIGELQSDVKSIIRTQADDRKFAAQYRTDIRKQMEDVVDEVRGLVREVTEMKPEVRLVTQDRLAREANAVKRAKRLKTAGALAALAASLFTFGRSALDGVLALWSHIWGIKPP